VTGGAENLFDPTTRPTKKSWTLILTTSTRFEWNKVYLIETLIAKQRWLAKD
jgi:hypothetical protein